MTTKHVLVLGALVLIVLGGTLLFGQKNPQVEGETVKIGLILPLTGEQANIGEAAKNASKLVMEKIQADTSLKYKYEFVIEDDSFDPTKTASAVQKLISVDKVNAIVSIGSGPGNVVNPIAEQAKIPHIGMASDANVAKGDYNFIDWTQPDTEVTTLIKEFQARGIQKIAILGVNQSGFLAYDKYLTQDAAAAGITITSDDTFNAGTTDFKTLIAKASQKSPDIYILNAFTPEVEILGQQILDAGIKTPMTSLESFGLSAKPKIFEGQWFINAAAPTSDFEALYREKFNAEVGPTAPNIYDSVSVIVAAVENTGVAGIPTGEQIDKALLKTKGYSGAMGSLTVTPDGIFLSTPSVKTIKDGKVVPYTK